jgi:hypothetical protein
MNIRMKSILLAAAFAAAGPALASQRTDQSDYFEMQREITDGYYAVHRDGADEAPVKSQARQQDARAPTKPD